VTLLISLASGWISILKLSYGGELLEEAREQENAGADHDAGDTEHAQTPTIDKKPIM